MWFTVWEIFEIGKIFYKWNFTFFLTWAFVLKRTCCHYFYHNYLILILIFYSERSKFRNRANKNLIAILWRLSYFWNAFYISSLMAQNPQNPKWWNDIYYFNLPEQFLVIVCIFLLNRTLPFYFLSQQNSNS